MKTPYMLLVESEEIKRQKTKRTIPGFYNFMPTAYNALIKLPFCMGNLADDSDTNLIKIQDLFQFFVYDFPFKMRNIFSMMETGSYADAAILFRSSVESFICYKYYILKNDGDGLSRYILRESKRSIKDIFEDVVPGYYDNIYAMLCSFAHGDPIIQAVFRGNVSKEKPLKSNINNINVDFFSYIANQLLPLIIGVVDLYKIVFPNNTIEQDDILKRDLNTIYDFIKEDTQGRKAEYPAQIQVIDYYEKIIEMPKN